MPKTRYASKTSVPAERSQREIEQVLRKYGADAFAYAWQSDKAVIVFEFHNRRMRFTLPLPVEPERETATRANERRAEIRRLWRALALSIKAKVVAVSDNIATVEQEFMGHIVLPNGETVAEWLEPQLERIYNERRMPPLLEGPRE